MQRPGDSRSLGLIWPSERFPAVGSWGHPAGGTRAPLQVTERTASIVYNFSANILHLWRIRACLHWKGSQTCPCASKCCTDAEDVAAASGWMAWWDAVFHQTWWMLLITQETGRYLCHRKPFCQIITTFVWLELKYCLMLFFQPK